MFRKKEIDDIPNTTKGYWIRRTRDKKVDTAKAPEREVTNNTARPFWLK